MFGRKKEQAPPPPTGRRKGADLMSQVAVNLTVLYVYFNDSFSCDSVTSCGWGNLFLMYFLNYHILRSV